MQVALHWFFEKFLLSFVYQMSFPKPNLFGFGPNYNPYMHLQIECLMSLTLGFLIH